MRFVSFLYGDSTEAPFTSNVLEFLRDALDFTVFVLHADQQVALGQSRMLALGQQADAELAHLSRFFGVVVGSIDGTEKGPAEAPTARCAAQLRGAILGMHRAWDDALRADLEAALGHVRSEDSALRAECVRSLAALLVAHDPPGTEVVTRLLLGPRGYEATRRGRAPFGLEWTLDLQVPDAWSGGARVDLFVPGVEIRAPQTTGWVKKEVKLRPVKLERHVVTQLVCDGEMTSFELNAEANAGEGFGVTVDAATVHAVRVGADGDDAATGPFELQPDDASALRALAQKLAERAASLAPHAVVAASLDGQDFQALPAFAPLVERLVAMLSPIVREIAQRSPMEGELVLRRPLADQRREEIFVAKETLLAKCAELPDAQRALFAPLGLEAPNHPAPSVAPAREPPALRAEIAPSVPPPPRVSRPPTPSQGPAQLDVLPEDVLAPPKSPSLIPPAPPAAAVTTLGPRPDDRIENEDLALTLRRIFNAARSGRTDHAYGKLAELFSSDSFAGYEPGDQREALRLVAHAEDPPRNDAVLAANRSALGHLKRLAETLADPADYEMLGRTHQRLDDDAAARAAFQKALELEQTRDAESVLAKSLAERLERP
jgi:hypothetical protein